MILYLNARYSRRPELNQVAKALEAFGHVISARWLVGRHQGDVDDVGVRDWALESLGDVDDAEVLVTWTDRPGRHGRARGGLHVVFGYALARGKRMIVVGPAGNIFHRIPDVELVENTAQLLRLLQPGGQHVTSR
jgi:hypothetical protein